MSTEWVSIVLDDNDEAIEIPTESDGTLLLSSVVAQFPGVTGLKYRNPASGSMRGIRCVENVLYPPSQDEGWGAVTYYGTKPKVECLNERIDSDLEREGGLNLNTYFLNVHDRPFQNSKASKSASLRNLHGPERSIE